LERLKKGVYGDIYNYPVQEYNNILDMEELQPTGEEEEDEEVQKLVLNLNDSVIAFIGNSV